MVGKLLKDLLYGGRNEYLDIVRLLALLGGLVFLSLTVVEFARTGVFDKLTFAGSWATLLGATVAAVWGRSHTDRLQRQDAAIVAVEPGQ
ncbi:MAG: hypothetical protein P0Y59_02670 [Candidatus Sphingomonas phytovorans]|nr:hypothetical protein [Sphingomonas sp.]WEK00615.1 MAG: hypothetical protein P0Y59_02670 [Sphingomonas sp.]